MSNLKTDITEAFGVYGIYYVKEGKLSVIKNKNAGPYINRFDLPEGSLEEDETY